MKSECDFYLDRAAKCLDMAEYVDKQYRGDLIQIARGWVQLAQEEAEWDPAVGESVVNLSSAGSPLLAPISTE
jgi:hypothetical protein